MLLLGGSFDPVHHGHMALAEHFIQLLQPQELRIIPAGSPWQKSPLQAPAADRVAMLECAFARQTVPVRVDQREILRDGPTYTIDTLRSLRTEAGPDTCLVFLIGADQLQQLPSWRDWAQLFDYAHLCAAARPGFALDAATLPRAVRDEFSRRAATPARIRTAACGLTCIEENLSVDISASTIRAALQQGERPAALIPATVLDYIEQHHLYQSKANGYQKTASPRH